MATLTEEEKMYVSFGCGGGGECDVDSIDSIG
jgi:hypothetical protein